MHRSEDDLALSQSKSRDEILVQIGKRTAVTAEQQAWRRWSGEERKPTAGRPAAMTGVDVQASCWCG